jgi:hypothetical protein
VLLAENPLANSVPQCEPDDQTDCNLRARQSFLGSMRDFALFSLVLI